MNDFTIGNYKIADENFIYVLNGRGSNRIWANVTRGHNGRGELVSPKETAAVALLFASAGNSAHDLAGMKVDALACVNILPEMVKVLEMIANTGMDAGQCRDMAKRLVSIVKEAK